MVLDVYGMQLHYDRHGEGRPLLWLHGGLGHGPDWRFIFPSEPAGYQLIAPDLRGHGRSTGARATYSFRQSALDVIGLLDHLGLDRVRIIGLSGGGITALHLAMIEPARVEAMVVVSAPPRFPEQARAIQRGFSLQAMSDDELRRMRERHRRERQLDLLLAQVRAFADGDDPNFTAAELGRIIAPTLIVFGDRDPLYPVSLGVELRDAIRRSWLWVVPNGGHGPVFGAAAPLFVETALSFLGGAFSSTQ
jgi:pimeloyl-ACP methyl ester carboxylesterase